MTLSIAHFIDSLDPARGGVVSYITDLALLCAGAGCNVRIVTSVDEPKSEALTDDSGVDIIRVPVPSKRGGRFTNAELDAAIAALRSADIVHFHGCWAMTNAQVARRLRALNKPYVASPHGMLDDWTFAQGGLKKRLYWRWFGQPVYEGAERVLYCAEGEMQQSARWVGGTKGIAIPAAMDLQPFRDLPGPALAQTSVPGAAGDEPIILFLSRIDPKKGIEKLLDAMAMIRDRRGPIALVLAGVGEDAYTKSLIAHAKRLGLSDSVHFVGLIRGTEKVSLFQRAYVLALPTFQENFGIVLTESLAAATPVITTNAVDIWPELEQSGGGLIAEQTPEAFASAIESLLDDPQLAQSMGEQGRAWVLEQQNPTTLSQRFIDAYSDAIGH